jgi:hypothetical protein
MGFIKGAKDMLSSGTNIVKDIFTLHQSVIIEEDLTDK